MATKKQMDAFDADKRNLLCATFGQAAECALANFDLDSLDRGYFQGIARQYDDISALNDMLRDRKGRLLWIRGAADPADGRPIHLTYLQSEWPSGAPQLTPLRLHESTEEPSEDNPRPRL